MAVNVSREGGIYIEIGGTVQPLADALHEAKKIGNETAQGISAAFKGAVSPADAGKISTAISSAFAQAKTAAQTFNKDISGYKQEFKLMGQEIGLTGKTLETFAKSQAEALHKKNADNFMQALRSIQKQTGKNREEMNALAKSLGGVGNEFDKVVQKSANQSSSLGSLLAGLRLGPASLAAAGAMAGYKIMDYGKEAFSLAAEYETLGVVVHQVGKVAGYSAIEIDKNVNAIRRMGIAGIEARKTLTQLAQAQVDLSKTPALARIAQDAAVIGGINSSEAFDRMVHGISAGNTMVLRNIGINVNFEQAYSRYAASIGKTTSELSEQEKMQARVNAVMDEGGTIAGAYEASMQTLGKQINSLSRIQQDFSTDTGKMLVDLAKASGAFDVYANAIESLNRAALESRGRGLGLTDLEMSQAKSLQELREMVETAASAKKELGDMAVQLELLDSRGIDTSQMRAELKALEDANFKVREEMQRVEQELRNIQNTSMWEYHDSSKVQKLKDDLKDLAQQADLGTQALIKLREIIAGMFSSGKSILMGTPFVAPDSQLGFQEMQKAADKVSKLYASTDKAREESLRAAVRQAEEYYKTLGSGKAKAVLDKAEKDLESFLNRGKGGGGGSPLRDYANTIKGINDEIARLTLSEKEYAQHKLTEKVAEWDALGVSAEKISEYQKAIETSNTRKSFDEASKAVQDFSRQYAQAFKDNESSTKAITAEMDQYRLAVVTAFGEGTSEAAELLAMIDQLQERLKEEASRDPWDGARRALRNYSEDATNAAKNVEDFTTNSFKSMEDSLVEFVTKGKFEFSSLVDSIISDLARIAIRQTITGPLAGGLMSALGGMMGGGKSITAPMSNPYLDKLNINMPTLPNAHGNIFAAGTGLSDYTNRIVSSPTLFPFAKGGIPNMGLMGEAGAEAIMPLTRLPDGDLGVRASGMGGGSSVEVNIIDQRSNQSEPVQVSESRGPDGMRQISVLIRDTVAGDISRRGSVYKAIGTMFDVDPRRGGY